MCGVVKMATTTGRMSQQTAAWAIQYVCQDQALVFFCGV
jgi:hypothetical protein